MPKPRAYKPLTIRPGLAPQDPRRIQQRNPPIALKYACGHVCVEYRGNMSRELEADVRRQCAQQPCHRCKKEKGQ